jgi:hypothetical protein
MRAEATEWNRRRLAEIDQELQRAIGDGREELVEERRLLLKDINRNPAPAHAKKKSPAQLDAEIAAALATPKHGAKPTSALAAPRATRATVTRAAVAKFGPEIEVFSDASGSDRGRSAFVSAAGRRRVAVIIRRTNSYVGQTNYQHAPGSTHQERLSIERAFLPQIIINVEAPTAAAAWSAALAEILGSARRRDALVSA